MGPLFFLCALGLSGSAAQAAGLDRVGQALLCAGLALIVAGSLAGRRHVKGRHARAGLARRLLRALEQGIAERPGAVRAAVETHEQVRAAERSRIARDLHDDLGQQLLTLKLELAALRRERGADSALDARLATIAGNLDRTVRALRRVVHDLHPICLEDGLQAAVLWQLNQFSRASGVGHRLVADPGLLAACHDPARQLVVLRVLQECLANVARHAQASEVSVVFGRHARELQMCVRDNGVGPTAPLPERGRGLRGMRERVAAAGGSVTFGRAPEGGAMLSLALPV